MTVTKVAPMSCGAVICGSQLAARMASHSRAASSFVNWLDLAVATGCLLFVALIFAARGVRRGAVTGLAPWVTWLRHSGPPGAD